MCGRLRLSKHSRHVIVPFLLKYWINRSDRLGCVWWAAIHLSTSCIDCINAAARPISGKCAMFLHVSLHSRQLGHNGFLSTWYARNYIVPAIPKTCFDAHDWNSLGKLWSVRWMDFQSTRSNCSKDSSLWLGWEIHSEFRGIPQLIWFRTFWTPEFSLEFYFSDRKMCSRQFWTRFFRFRILSCHRFFRFQESENVPTIIVSGIIWRQTYIYSLLLLISR